MNANPALPDPPRTTVVAVVAATTAAQVASVLGTTVFPVIAPELAASLDLDASLVGYQVSLIYGVGMAATVFAGIPVQRWGACRTTQVGLALGAAAMLLAMTSNVAALVGASVLLGVGLSVMPAASSHLLFRFSPPANRNFIFGLKQTGIPIAWVIMAVVAPPIALGFGWRWALAVVLVATLATAAAMQRWRDAWDDDRGRVTSHGGGFAEAVGTVWRHAPLRWISVTSFFFSFLQMSVATFAVTMLVEEVGYQLVAAGFLLSLMHAVGAAGRIFWGWVADAIGDGLRVLVGLAWTMIACCGALAFLSPAWPAWLVTALFAVFGASAVGWNGIFFAEAARHSPHGRVSVGTGGAMAWNYAGVLAGPAVFATAYQLVGSYAAAIGTLTLAGGAGIYALRRARQSGLARAAEGAV
jgi:MFS family permease